MWTLVALLCCFSLARAEERCLLIDTDVDLDDAMALAFSCTQDAADLHAVTVSGTGFARDSRRGTQVVRRILQRCGLGVEGSASADENVRVVRVAAGRQEALGHTQYRFPQTWYAAADRFYRQELDLPEAVDVDVSPVGELSSASRLILETARDCLREGKLLDILALAPLTNLAEAVLAEPELMREAVGDLYLSGGNLNATMGNDADCGGTLNTAECNIFMDAVAASHVMSSRLPIHIVDTMSSTFLPVSKELPTVLHAQLGSGSAPASDMSKFMIGCLEVFVLTSAHTLYFYDPSVAVWRHLRRRGQRQGGLQSAGSSGALAAAAESFCFLHEARTVAVSTEKTSWFGTLVETSDGAPADFCSVPSAALFLRAFLTPFFGDLSAALATMAPQGDVGTLSRSPAEVTVAASSVRGSGAPRRSSPRGGRNGLAFLIGAAGMLMVVVVGVTGRQRRGKRSARRSLGGRGAEGGAGETSSLLASQREKRNAARWARYAPRG
mmetsp:Transcript_16455/g.62530  ORF Transcript_16455/g.62530 Transcript_16455/m.62530 type:complete len:498 (-) Transcript_16455:1493-2986(-)